MYENEPEHVRRIMSTCCTETICQDIRSSIMYCDNHESGIICKMSGDSIHESDDTDRRPMLSGDMPSDHTTSVNTSSKSRQAITQQISTVE